MRSNFALSTFATVTLIHVRKKNTAVLWNGGAIGGKRVELLSEPDDGEVSGGDAWLTTTIIDPDTALSRPVRSAIRYMAQNYGEPLTLKDLSAVTNLSSYQIIRAFHRELGTTPHAWLIRHRVTLATALLQQGESIATIAFEVGFADQTHLTRHFKRIHGKTPARFAIANERYRPSAAKHLSKRLEANA